MGLSAGTGSPAWFVCPVERRERHAYRYTMMSRLSKHTVNLTGRTRPYRPSAGSALGQRSTDTAREYECSCGHVGWSNHIDLERLATQGRIRCAFVFSSKRRCSNTAVADGLCRTHGDG